MRFAAEWKDNASKLVKRDSFGVKYWADNYCIIIDEELTLKQIIRFGIYQFKVERAIQLYRDGMGSLGYVAEQIGLNKQDLIREARYHNINPEYSERTIKEELSKILHVNHVIWAW